MTGPGAGAGARVASWPHWYGPNPYLELLYEALRPHGVEHVPFAPLDPDAYAGGAPTADILHLHWAYPLWRERGGRATVRGRRIRAALDRLGRIRAHGIDLVWTVHNLVPHDGLRRGEREAYAALHALADLRVFHSESARSEAAALYGAGWGETIVQRHGNWDGALPAPGPGTAARAREGVPDGPRILLCFGQIRPYKGYERAIEAVRRLDPGAYHLIVAGRALGAESRRLRRLARGARNVSLALEELDDQRLADVLGLADAVLLPYHAVTGSGVLHHALTAGRGVICTDLPYFRETLAAEPDAGVLVGHEDVEALIGGVHEFFSEPTGVRGRAARRLADTFAWPTVVEPLVDWLRQRGHLVSRPRMPEDGDEDGEESPFDTS